MDPDTAQLVDAIRADCTDLELHASAEACASRPDPRTETP